MKAGASSLNPYAASYVPLSRRAGAPVDKEFSSAQELNRANGAFHQNVSLSYGHKDGAILPGGFIKPKVHRGGEFFTSSSQHVSEIPEKLNMDEEMAMAYLQMTFPGISYESLHGVYLTNGCELDAAVDMINMLEIHSNNTSETLPDTLDIGDVPEPPHMPSNQVAKSHTTEKKASGFASSGLPKMSSPSS